MGYWACLQSVVLTFDRTQRVFKHERALNAATSFKGRKVRRWLVHLDRYDEFPLRQEVSGKRLISQHNCVSPVPVGGLLPVLLPPSVLCSLSPAWRPIHSKHLFAFKIHENLSNCSRKIILFNTLLTFDHKSQKLLDVMSTAWCFYFINGYFLLPSWKLTTLVPRNLHFGEALVMPKLKSLWKLQTIRWVLHNIDGQTGAPK